MDFTIQLAIDEYFTKLHERELSPEYGTPTIRDVQNYVCPLLESNEHWMSSLGFFGRNMTGERLGMIADEVVRFEDGGLIQIKPYIWRANSNSSFEFTQKYLGLAMNGEPIPVSSNKASYFRDHLV